MSVNPFGFMEELLDGSALSMGVSAFVLIFSIIVMAFALLFGIAMLILMGIPLYRMMKKRGLPHPWLAFIPYGQNYAYCLLGEGRPFSIFGKQLFKKRTHAFWALLAISLGVSLLMSILMAVMAVSMGVSGGLFGSDSSVSMLIFGIIQLATSLFSFLIALASCLYEWRCLYDVLEIFEPQRSNNMTLSVVTVVLEAFVSLAGVIMHIVLLWKAAKNEPEAPVEVEEAAEELPLQGEGEDA